LPPDCPKTSRFEDFRFYDAFLKTDERKPDEGLLLTFLYRLAATQEKRVSKEAAEIATTEVEIDDLVCELYGLTNEEKGRLAACRHRLTKS
jgi:hypothetical protein